MAETSDLKGSDEDRRAQQCAQKWIAEIGISERAQRKWLERAKKITRRYKDENRAEADTGKRRFAILWANTETTKPAIYARSPQPVVSRRFDDDDPVARLASEVLERSLATSIELQDLDGRLKECRDDFALIGRGQTWERYVPTHGPEIVPELELQVISSGDGQEGEVEGYEDSEGNRLAPDDERIQRRDDGSAYMAGEPYRPVTYEESVTDYVNWEDFGHSVARTWNEVTYVWRRVYLSREQLKKRFGDNLGSLVPLDWGPVQQGQRDLENQYQRKAAVYEIWDITTKKVYWISKSWSSRPLDERDDPLGLEGFFPCPRPLLATTANDSVIPVPDFVYYQDQAEEIDKLTARIGELQDALKVRGFYAADQKTNLNTLFNASNNMLIPVPDWITMKEGGGVRGNIEWYPIDQVVNALNAIIDQRQRLINDVYEITGIGDILRGMNDPRATATAERLKGAWGTLRIRTKQVEMMRFARDVLRIKAEVIAEKFDPETLKQISGVKIPTAAEKQQVQAQVEQGAQQYQMAVQQAQLAQQPPPPQPEIPPEMQAILSSPTWEDVIALMRDNAGRQFRIEVETDSTIEPDEAEQKASAIEFTTALGQFITQWGPQVAAQPALAPLAAGVLGFVIRRFRAGRELEALVEQTMQKIMAQPPPQEQAEAPDKTPVEVQQLKNAQEQMKQQAEDGRAQLEAQVDREDMALRAQETQLKLVVGQRDPEPQVTY
jgi:hypothetical protein